MGLLDKLFGDKKEDSTWTEIKKGKDIYPQNSISLLMLKTKSGRPGTGWIDKAYEKYAYKKFCPFNILIKVDLADSIVTNNPGLDMGTVEEYFMENVRKICIGHIVARLVTDEGMNIEMYVEKGKQVVEMLETIHSDSKRLVSFNYEINKDPKWTAISGLMNL